MHFARGAAAVTTLLNKQDVIGRNSISDTTLLALLDFRNAINQGFVSSSIYRVSVVIYLTMKLVVLILTFLAVSVELGNCQYDYSYGDYYNDYPAALTPREARFDARDARFEARDAREAREARFEAREARSAPEAREARFRHGRRQLFSPFARPAPSSRGFLSQFTTGRPTWTPYPGTLVTLQLLSQLQIVPTILNIFFRVGVMNCNRPNCARLFRSFKFKPGQGKCK